MDRHGRRELVKAALPQPFGAGRTVAQRLKRVIQGQHLVQVVEKRRGLDGRVSSATPRRTMASARNAATSATAVEWRCNFSFGFRPRMAAASIREGTDIGAIVGSRPRRGRIRSLSIAVVDGFGCALMVRRNKFVPSVVISTEPSRSVRYTVVP